MSTRSLRFVVGLALGLAAGLGTVVQTADNPLVAGTRVQYDEVKGYLVRAADQLPDTLYGFKATPEVRSFAQLFGHIADTNNQICAAVLGDKPPAGVIEKSKTSKADLKKALADSFALCDRAFASTTDADAAKPVDFFGSPMPKLAALAYNAGHDYEHYGNIVTYLRLNKMVPPSSQPMK
jgi:uncharacterized damage-inducible protein DinB